MKILILGAGKMGSFFCDLLSFEHEVAVYDTDPQRLRFTFNCQRFSDFEEIRDFEPQLVINAVTVKYTIDAFRQVMPLLPPTCILSDIASVKTGLPEFYATCGHPFASTHPMFGPTFARLDNLGDEKRHHHRRKRPPRQSLLPRHLQPPAPPYRRIHLCRARHHHRLLAVHTLCLHPGLRRRHETPRRPRHHIQAAHGHSSRSDERRRLPTHRNPLQPPTPPEQLRAIRAKLAELSAIVESGDAAALRNFLDQVRENIA